MEEIKNKMKGGQKEMKREWKGDVVKWFQPHMVNLYSVVFLSIALCVVSWNTLLMLTPFEDLVVKSCIVIIMVLNISMLNNCMIRQTVEELKLELTRIK